MSKMESTLNELTDIYDRWTMVETLDSMVSNPSKENQETIEKAIGILTQGEFNPYQKTFDPVDPDTACQMIIYYAKTDVFLTDPYAVQAVIPYVGNQADFLSRQLRSMANGDRNYAIYKLLEAQREIASRV